MNSQFAEFQPDVEPLGTVTDHVNEFINAVQSSTLIEGLTREETGVLGEYLACFGVPRHSTVLREGDGGDFLAILITGSAVITKRHGDVEKMVATLRPGDMVGEMSMIDGQTRFASCVTTLPSDFAVLTHDKFKALLADHPALGNKLLLALLRTATVRLRHATQTMLPNLTDVGFV
ncbi:cyclic nucleotide-binding domain-containing protein [Rhodoferax fermentans]|uniref:Cyclic nucleotide-binding domain-containing protein n=1 Tax=Rhodoferax fermentans TaxID=28066 RepID=A0A1T1AUP1_RHOFE|nr:cyclic nucleotide-binding domain-containing protein [Rhodoferax fermentans]OOV07733.1 hypothetical protein RF819_14295 [Rhodoferax fermentans]